MQKPLLLFFITLLIPLYMMSQEHHGVVTHPVVDHSFKPFRIGMMIGHTAVPTGYGSEHVFIPSWGLDLEYWLNEKWGIGSHNDIEIESFIVKSDLEDLIEREYPLVTTLEVLYKPWKGLVLQFGGGIEIEKEKNYSLIRYGIEYEFELPGHWDIFPTFFYDTRVDAYDTCSIGVGVGKRF